MGNRLVGLLKEANLLDRVIPPEWFRQKNTNFGEFYPQVEQQVNPFDPFITWAPWMAMGGIRSVFGPTLGAGVLGGLAAGAQYASDYLMFPKMRRAAYRQGARLGHANPFIDPAAIGGKSSE